MKKRIVRRMLSALSLLLICAFALAACGGPQEDGGNAYEPPVVAAKYEFDKSSPADIRVDISLNGAPVLSIEEGGNTLAGGTDYTYADNVIVLDESYFSDKAVGSELTFTVTTAGGSTAFQVTVKQSQTPPIDVSEPEKPVIVQTEYSFDLYQPQDITVIVDLKGEELQSVKCGGLALTSGEDYAFADGKLVLKQSYFGGAEKGEVLSFTVATAGGSADFSVQIEDSEPQIPETKTVVEFWGYSGEAEVRAMGEIVEEFNATVGKENKVEVDYRPLPAGSYSSSAATALSSNTPPDIVYVEDGFIKSWALAKYLEPLTGGEIDFPGLEEDFLADGKIWEQGIQRYRYDVETATVTDDATLWALPKDIGPTVIYYNVNYMEQLCIEIISVPADQLDAFNAGTYVDGNGKTKSQYGITGTVKEKGYFELDGKKYYNNRVPMSWDEPTALARLMQEEITPANGASMHGFFTEWWFSYCWSVGGDCIEYVTDSDKDGYYDFTLNDKTPNYIVADDAQPFTVNEHTYQPGEIISYRDKFKDGTFDNVSNANVGAGEAVDANIRNDIKSAVGTQLNKLPSQYDAFLEFCSLTVAQSEVVGKKADGTDKKGAGKVSMGPTSLGAQGAEDLFAFGNIGMFVDGRWETTFLRASGMEAGSWDVAPLPVYKEYDENGDIAVHGIQAGHSGSVGLAISAGSDAKAASWLFLRYVAGEEGQTVLAESGLSIPNQPSLANSELFLQSDQDPKNSIVFVEAAAVETPGDWWYLPDGDWITDWANDLNYRVREGRMTVDQLWANNADETQEILYEYTQYVPNRLY